MMKRQQGGFTLIELIMVIVILGILAAVALPRFADLSGNARLASMQGALGAVKSASAIVHSQMLANNASDNASQLLEGQPVATVGKYPAPTAAGIVVAAQLSDTDYDLSPEGDTLTVAAKNKAACKFTYKMAAADTAPTIDGAALTSTNCN